MEGEEDGKLVLQIRKHEIFSPLLKSSDRSYTVPFLLVVVVVVFIVKVLKGYYRKENRKGMEQLFKLGYQFVSCNVELFLQ